MKRIEICGGIATGKTWLARSLCHHAPYQLVEEKYREVPFWEKFYTATPDSRANYELQKNISFLMFHAESIRDGKASDSRNMVCDFAMFQDLAYAALSPDLHILESIYDRLIDQVGLPNAIIKLKCAPEIQLERIRRRGRLPEQSIDRTYLNDLHQRIEERLGKMLQGYQIDVREIDTGTTDFVSNTEAKKIAELASTI